MKTWTNEEIAILKESYIKEGDKKLSTILNKTPNAIRIKASRLGISKLKIRENIHLSKDEDQIVIGTLLGDSHSRIHKPAINAILEGAHCKEQEAYLFWKINSLKSLSFYTRKSKDEATHFASRTFPCLNEYFLLFYRKGIKIVNSFILNKIESLALAVWYMDDGSYNKTGKNSSLYTNSFTFEENTLIKNWFEQKWNISPKISNVKKENREIKYYLRFNVRDTRNLIEIIRPYIHPCMNYKIGEK